MLLSKRLSELIVPRDLSRSAQLELYWQLKPKVTSSNPDLDTFLLSWKITIRIKPVSVKGFQYAVI